MDIRATGAAPDILTPEAAVRSITPGSRIFLGSACATPQALIAALEAMASPPADVELVSFVAGMPPGGSPALRSRFRHRIFFVGSDMRAAVASGLADYVPIALDEVPALLASGRLRIDLALLQVSPPDPRGFVSLGVSVELGPAVLATGCRAIAEMLPGMPRTHGESFVPAGRFAALVPVTGGVAEYLHPPLDAEVARRVARHAASVIEDGSTLHVGMGRLPNEALRHLADRRDLGFHGDVVMDGVLDLVEAGALTGARKRSYPGRVVASRAFGSARLYAALDDNPLFAFLPIERACDQALLASEPKLVSLTQAFAVDLTGQATVDHAEGTLYGGISTQPAFLRAAARSAGGKPIICLPATAPDGQSNIRDLLPPGAAVGVPRADVHFVATEHGIAHLFGKSLRERALALIEIADPAHRPALLDAAKARGLLPAGQRLASQRPYPVEEERRVALKDGAEVLIRPTRAGDAPAVQALFHRLSEEDRYTRFFARLRSLSQQEAERLCNVDHDTAVAFLAVTGPREAEEAVASACYFLDPRSNLAEVAYMVAPAWQGRGLGAALQSRLQDYAQARGVRGFVAAILPRNARMKRLAATSAGRVTIEREEDEVRMTIMFEAPA
ncbi:GNAT family N-acetyltransferase [Falsiroseomonas oryzae]|uniref:GNAT family N-acetyltransferase n=1 Tax=Falsiroseomonas oryzae TaxID=2766473 RepID=UPI0022EB8827|nr:GNAT family N-acetyltransferase [Roseomonas sp. MO-31]